MKHIKKVFGVIVLILLSSCSESRDSKTTPEQGESNIQYTSVVETQQAIEKVSDTLVIPIGSSIVTFYNMPQSPILTKEFVDSNDTLYFELSEILGTDWDLFNVIFRIESVDLEAVAVSQYFCVQALFNNDGSGGIYAVDGVEEHCNEKVQLTNKDDYTFLTMSDTENFPHSNAQDSITIEKFLQESNSESRKELESDIVLQPTEYITKTIFDFYIADKRKVLCFMYSYGD